MMFVEENGLIRVIATNGTEAIAKKTVITITLPVSFDFVSADPAVVQVDNVLTYDVGDFAIESSVQIDVTVSPTLAGTFISQADLQAQNPATSVSVLHDEYTHTVFDRRSCAVVNLGVNGGGDLFDCYDDGELAGQPAAGTGFASYWLYDDVYDLFGDDFDSYADEDPLSSTDLEGGTGFTGAWLHE